MRIRIIDCPNLLKRKKYVPENLLQYVLESDGEPETIGAGAGFVKVSVKTRAFHGLGL
jgi:hypothetical protein